MRTFDDEISYGTEPTVTPALPHTRTSVHVLGVCGDAAIGTLINSPETARDVFLPMMLRDRETLAVMLLDDSRTVLTAFVVAVGTSNMVACEPSAIFRPALLLGASHVLIAHNHPSGDPTPSFEDIQTTKMIEACAKILGVGFVDHLVLTATGRYRSIAEYMFQGC